MTVKDALKGIKTTIRQSENSYEGSDVNIVYMQLSQEFHGQDHLVLSANAAEEYLNSEDKRAYLADCEVSYSEEAGCYGVIRHQTTIVLQEVTW